MKDSPWLVRFGPDAGAPVRLFCFPYAGGGAHIYYRWRRGLPAWVDVCAVQPPGRGTRLSERPFTDLSEMVEAAAGALAPYMDRPFAFFGHSMGAMVSFELARRLRQSTGTEPGHLFLSGCRAPQFSPSREVTYNLPEDEFTAFLSRRGGTPSEVLENQELMQLLLPLLRADFAVTQTYRFEAAPPLSCPITVFGGRDDEGVRGEWLEGWREHAAGAFALHVLPGDHFFVHTSERLLLEAVAGELRRLAGDFG
jgi:medium-chain acyl-[acyl-carrier-protein] hydrolase